MHGTLPPDAARSPHHPLRHVLSTLRPLPAAAMLHARQLLRAWSRQGFDCVVEALDERGGPAAWPALQAQLGADQSPPVAWPIDDDRACGALARALFDRDERGGRR